MRINWLVAAVLLFPIAATAQPCSPQIPPSDLVAPGSLQMAINPTLPPQQFVDAKGELQGLNVDLMNEVAKRLCIPMAFIRMDFPPMFPALARPSAARPDRAAPAGTPAGAAAPAALLARPLRDR